MNGNIEVKSQRGIGSTFTLRIEINESEGDVDEAIGCKKCLTEADLLKKRNFTQHPLIKPIATQGDINLNDRLYILVVDDNVANVFCLSALLRKLGFKTDSASNGKEAVEKYQIAIREYDRLIVFMDINMPIMNGVEAMQQISRISNEKSVPFYRVIAVTAQDEKSLSKQMNGFYNISKQIIST